MDKNEQIQLIKSYMDGDKDAAIKLAQEAVHLSISIASHYAEIGSSEFSKYVPLAFAGFYHGLNLYIKDKRYTKDYKFNTYATYFMKNNIEKNLK